MRLAEAAFLAFALAATLSMIALAVLVVWTFFSHPEWTEAQFFWEFWYLEAGMILGSVGAVAFSSRWYSKVR